MKDATYAGAKRNPEKVQAYRTLPTVASKTPVQEPPPQALRFSHGRGERETQVTGH